MIASGFVNALGGICRNGDVRQQFFQSDREIAVVLGISHCKGPFTGLIMRVIFLCGPVRP